MQAPYMQTAVHTVWRLAASLSVLAALAACGYKGPLYMPPPPAPEESLVAPPTSGAVPPAASQATTEGAPPQAIPVK